MGHPMRHKLGIEPKSPGPLANTISKFLAFKQKRNIYLYIYILISSNAKPVDGENDSIFQFSIYNIHVIQNPKENSM